MQKFSSLCKKSPGDKIAKYLEYNRDLLNCLDGLPLREAARGGNIEVVDKLLGTSGILVNLQSKKYLFFSCLGFILLCIPVDVHGLTALHFASITDNPDLVQKLLDHEDIQPNIKDKKGFTPVMSASFKGKTNSLKVTDKIEDDFNK